MNLRRLFRRKPPPPLFVTGIAAGIAHGAACATHGDDSFALSLTGTYDPDTDDDTTIQLVMSRCEAADVFGVLAAIAHHYGGQNERDTFMTLARHSYQEAHARLRKLAAAGQLCCEAGRTTRGREHTCDRKATPS